MTITSARRLRLFDETNYRVYRERWREIDRLWPACGDPESWDVVARMRAYARDELRTEMRAAINVGEPKYLVPV